MASISLFRHSFGLDKALFHGVLRGVLAYDLPCLILDGSVLLAQNCICAVSRFASPQSAEEIFGFGFRRIGRWKRRLRPLGFRLAAYPRTWFPVPFSERYSPEDYVLEDSQSQLVISV